jgi:hypothetical protein
MRVALGAEEFESQQAPHRRGSLDHHRLIGLDPWPRGLDKERPVGPLVKLMDELLEAAGGVSEASRDLGSGELLHKTGPQGFVLAVRGVLRSEKDLSQVH